MRARWRSCEKAADRLRTRFAKTAALLEEVTQDVLASRRFQSEHQRQLHSTNVLERLNEETTTERFGDADAFLTRVLVLEQELANGQWTRVGSSGILPGGWRGETTD